MFQTDWLNVFVTHQPFKYNDPKSLLRGRGTSIIMKLNESNKEEKIPKKGIYVDSNSGPFGCKFCTIAT